MNKAKLLGASIVGNGLRYARRPDVFVGPANNGFMAGDFLDANGVVDTSSAITNNAVSPIAERLTADEENIQSINTLLGNIDTLISTYGPMIQQVIGDRYVEGSDLATFMQNVLTWITFATDYTGTFADIQQSLESLDTRVTALEGGTFNADGEQEGDDVIVGGN